LLVLFTLLLLCASTFLWWLLSRAQQRNAELQAEIVKLRGRLRSLRA